MIPSPMTHLMKVIRSINEEGPPEQSVVTIGNFDGFHLGHRAILQEVKSNAEKIGATAVAITFEPHPLQFLAPKTAPTLLMSADQKVRILAANGINLMLTQEFNRSFSELSAHAFIKQYLIDYFKARIVCVGQNFRFGYKHKGNTNTLREYNQNFEVIEVPPVTLSKATISSSRIRKDIADGNVKLGRKMLGRLYEIEGKVVSGFARGRVETVPTINMEDNGELLPADGVYVSRIALDRNDFLPAVTNIGFRPTFNGKERTIETHILDYSLDEKPTHAAVQFMIRLRSEKKYSHPDKLKDQIRRDTSQARRLFHHLDRALQRPQK